MSLFNKILVPVDFSPHSDEAVDQAVELCKEFGAELHIAHAFSLPIPLAAPYEVSIPTELFEQARESAEQHLRSTTEKLKERGIDAKPHLLEVPAAPSIVALADELGIDLIVMGTRGLTGIKHVVLGSVAERTLRLAKCPVLSVKRNE